MVKRAQIYTFFAVFLWHSPMPFPQSGIERDWEIGDPRPTITAITLIVQIYYRLGSFAKWLKSTSIVAKR